MGRLSTHAYAASALLLLAAVVALTACGQEGERSDVAPASSNTLYVRVAGMVQSDGIT